MKPGLLLFLLLSLIGNSSVAATVSGNVWSVAACGPVSGQKVYIADSSKSFMDSTLTNSSGAYSFSLPASLPSPSTLFITTNNCGTISQGLHWYYGGNLAQDFIICGSPTQMVGNVTVGSRIFNIHAKVYLILKKYDPVLMDTTLTAIDSVVANTFMGSYEFNMLCKPAGTMLIKAALLPADSNYAAFLPSYYVTSSTASLTWNGAAPANSPAIFDIAMIAGTNPGGPGFIGGSVLVGANKSSAVGDPLSGRILLLSTSAGAAVGYTFTDATGKFSFPNLAYGTYKLSGDALGKANPELTVTISPSQASANKIVFEENNKAFKGHLNGLGTGTIPALAGISVYPNPAGNMIRTTGLETVNGSKTLLLYNITGHEVIRTTITSGEAHLDTGSLPDGVYQLQVITEAGTATFRIIR